MIIPGLYERLMQMAAVYRMVIGAALSLFAVSGITALIMWRIYRNNRKNQNNGT